MHALAGSLQVGSSEAALLQKLNIRPFTYGLVVGSVYDNGSLFDAAVLDITDADMSRKFASACANIAAVSLELGYPTLASLPHSISNAFRALVSVVIEGCEKYSFDEADTVKVRRGACYSPFLFSCYQLLKCLTGLVCYSKWRKTCFRNFPLKEEVLVSW